MYDAKGLLLYVGKAKSLKNRLSSYFREQQDARIATLVSQIDKIEVTVTHNEKEALLLENELIKTKKPKFNIVLRDDKSYPYLFMSNHDYPRLSFHRGPQKAKGEYFGPYPSAYAVKETLNILQRLFKLRQCDDVYFNNRSRPCLQYQIKRCSAPCVAFINQKAYRQDADHAKMFLQGQHQAILAELITSMNDAATDMAYEQAAVFRDQIQHIQKIIEQQAVYSHQGDIDIIACESAGSSMVFYVLFVRQGKMSGSKRFYLNTNKIMAGDEIYMQFLSQFYLTTKQIQPPRQIITSFVLEDKAAFLDAFFEHVGRKVQLIHNPKEQKRRWLNLAIENAKLAVKQKVGTKKVYWQRFIALKKALGLTTLNRMECFDISHTFGEETVGSCVVFDEEGPNKASYRQYNIDKGDCDDYKAMSEVLSRRYKKLKEQGDTLPELVFIDGGKGQLNIARNILNEYQMVDVKLVGVAKGEGRKPGLETLYVVEDYQSDEFGIVHLPPHHEALHLIQQIRDEAHRFAIKRHRAKRDKKRKTSPLEAIEGVGPKRRQQLLTHFGGQKALLAASEEALAQVPGISKALAAKIYQHLHES